MATTRQVSVRASGDQERSKTSAGPSRHAADAAPKGRSGNRRALRSAAGKDLEQQIAALRHGDHVCSFYETPDERKAIAIPFIKEALGRGECCICIADDADLDEIAKGLMRGGLDVVGEQERRSLLLIGQRESERPGRLDIEAMTAALKQRLDRAVAAGLPGLWLVVEIPSTLGEEITLGQLNAWESYGNEVLSHVPAVVLCQYNRSRLSPVLLGEALATHPLAIFDNQVHRNIFCEPPGLLGDREAPKVQVEWMLQQLRWTRTLEQASARHPRDDAAGAEAGPATARITRFVEGFADGFFALDNEWRYTYVNEKAARAAARLTSKTREELIGQNIWELFPDRVGTFIYGEYHRAVRDRVALQVEEYSPLLGAWYEVHLQPAEEELLVYYRDITKRKKVEQELTANEQRFRALLESAFDAVALVRPDGTITYSSPSITRILGYGVDEFVGHSVFDFVHPDDLARTSELFRKLLEEPGGRITAEFGYLHKDGTWRLLECTGTNLLEEPGVAAIVVNVRDISERKRVEIAQRLLAEEGNLLDTSLDYQATLQAVARLMVPEFADWCAVDILEEGKGLRRLAVAHSDPAKVEFARQLIERYPVDLGAPHGVAHVLRTGQPEFLPDIPDALLVESIRDPEQLRLVREVGLQSAIIAPLIAHGRTLGAMAFATAESGRHYDETDLALAQEMARRAALAIDNARLFEAEQAARARADNILESISDAFFALDRQWRYTYINQRASELMEQVLHKTREQVLGRSIWEEFPASVRSRSYREFHRAVKEQITVQFDDFFPGVGRWLETHVYPSKDGLSVYFRDVTERRQAQQRLTLFREIIARSTEAIAIIDLQGGYIEQNAAHSTLLGYTWEDLEGKTPAIHMGEAQFAAVTDSLTTTGRFFGELSCRRKDGSAMDIELTAFVVRDDAGVPLCYVGIKRDVTQRKRADAALRARALQQAAVAELGRLALSGADLSELMNEAALKVAQTLNVEYSKILELLPGGQEFLLRAGVGWKEGLIGRARVGAGTQSQAGYALVSDGPVIVKDLRKETRFDGPHLLLDHEVVSGMSVIIRSLDTPFGVIGAHTTKQRIFTQEDVDFLAAVANVLGEAIARKRTEEELRDSEERYRRLLEYAPEAIFVHIDGRIAYANAATVRLFGADRAEELIGRSIFDFVHPDSHEAVADYIQEAGNGKRYPGLLIQKGKRLDGKVVDMEVIGIPITYGGTPARQVIARDVTERKRAEQTLNLYRQIIASTSDAVAIIGRDGHFVDQNEAFRRLTGHSDDELQASTPAAHLGAMAFAAVRQELLRQGGYAGELRSKHKNGKTTEIELTAFAIPENEGAPDRFVLIMRDIRERKRAEELLVTQERELAVLQERNRLAGEIHDTLAQHFVGINLQLGAVELEWTDAPEKVAHSVKRSRELAREGIRQSKTLVWNLVPTELDGRPFEVVLSDEIDRFSALGEWTGTFRLSGRRRNLPHNLQVGLLRVCQEALANVNKHAHAEHVVATLAYHKTMVTLAIQDDGVGFDAGGSGAAAIKGRYGLISMEERVRQLGGKLRLTSAPGKGTTIRVVIPWSPDAES